LMALGLTRVLEAGSVSLLRDAAAAITADVLASQRPSPPASGGDQAQRRQSRTSSRQSLTTPER
jgi:hypothetical protein